MGTRAGWRAKFSSQPLSPPTLSPARRIMIANNIAVLTAIDHAPSIHSSLFDAAGSMSCFCFFYVLVRAPFLIALATHLGEHGPAQLGVEDSAIHQARRLFRHGAPLIFCAFGLGLLMAAACFVLDVPALKGEHNLNRYGVDFWIRGSFAIYSLIRAWRDLKGDVQRFVRNMGEVMEPTKHPGYSWVWWFGPFGDAVIDVGSPLSARAIWERIWGLLSSTGPDASWMNIY